MSDEQWAGWLLDEDDRSRLLGHFPPRFSDVVADHVTLCRADAPGAQTLMACVGKVVGHAHDPGGVEALVVEIAGTTRRPDGGVYHLTWSLDASAGRKAVHSNDVIAASGWSALPSPVQINLEPGSWPASRYS